MPSVLPSDRMLHQEMLDAIPFSVYAVDIETRQIIYANQYFLNHRPQKEVLHQPCHQMVNGLDAPCSFCRREELLTDTGQPNGRVLTYEFFNEFDEKWYQLRESAFYWSDGRVVKCVIAVDISDLKATQNHLAEAHAQLALKHRELEYLASRDTLTKVYNRTKLQALLTAHFQEPRATQLPFSIISVDIDFFKRINDSYGHLMGDKVLIQVAQTMQSTLMPPFVLGRWGGEEFLILCPNTLLADAQDYAHQLLKAVAQQPYETGECHTISVGLTTQTADDTLESLLSRADEALYQAKSGGRNCMRVV